MVTVAAEAAPAEEDRSCPMRGPARGEMEVVMESAEELCASEAVGPEEVMEEAGGGGGGEGGNEGSLMKSIGPTQH